SVPLVRPSVPAGRSRRLGMVSSSSSGGGGARTGSGRVSRAAAGAGGGGPGSLLGAGSGSAAGVTPAGGAVVRSRPAPPRAEAVRVAAGSLQLSTAPHASQNDWPGSARVP